MVWWRRQRLLGPASMRLGLGWVVVGRVLATECVVLAERRAKSTDGGGLRSLGLGLALSLTGGLTVKWLAGLSARELAPTVPSNPQ